MAKKNTGRKDPKEYMKLAIEVIKKSIPERKKNDPSPYVGASWFFLMEQLLPLIVEN